jgi:sulfate transport system ATP-binding protein
VSLRIEGLSKSFGPVRALDDIDFHVPSGSLTALLGPSGCGKTTLLRTIAGFEVPDAGRILLQGEDVTRVRLGARDIGFVFQSYALFPHLCVADNVAFGLAVRGAGKRERAARVRELLDLVRLPGYERRMPHQLSGGQRQRVALARALAAKPAFLLLDEPFAALDLTVRKELRRWLRGLHEQTHVTTLIVTHDADEAMDISDRIVLMQGGRVLQSGSPSQLYAAPRTSFVMRFFGDANAVRMGGDLRYVRPHDVRVAAEPFANSHAARAERIVDLGSRTHLELRLEDGERIVAELPEGRAAGPGFTLGATYHVAFEREQSFASREEREVPA